jgi:hypothetical protein
MLYHINIKLKVSTLSTEKAGHGGLEAGEEPQGVHGSKSTTFRKRTQDSSIVPLRGFKSPWRTRTWKNGPITRTFFRWSRAKSSSPEVSFGCEGNHGRVGDRVSYSFHSVGFRGF